MKPDVIQFLRDELIKRSERNPRYSMRAFAKSLGLNVGSLSGFLSGKRTLTVRAAEDLCKKLGMSTEETANIVQLAAEKSTRPKPFTIRFSDKQLGDRNQTIYRTMSDWITSLANNPPEASVITSRTITIDPGKIEEAKKLISDFQETLQSKLAPDMGKQVYQLSVSFFPFQVREN